MAKFRIKKSQKRRCHYCDKECGRKYTWDHIVPVSRGGLNDWINIVPACDECNNKKANKEPEPHCGFCIQSITLHALYEMPSLEVPFDRLPVVDWEELRPTSMRPVRQFKPDPYDPIVFDCS